MKTSSKTIGPTIIAILGIACSASDTSSGSSGMAGGGSGTPGSGGVSQTGGSGATGGSTGNGQANTGGGITNTGASTGVNGSANTGSSGGITASGSGGISGSTGSAGGSTGITGGDASAGTSGVSGGEGGGPFAGDASAGKGDAANDASAGSTCPGVPIVPDANGFVAPASNSVGIQGSWFVYSDCVDLKGKNCATVTTPAGTGKFPNVGGKICTSGQTSNAAGAWGAGIALELNDGPPQRPYDTVAHDVKGFCFQLSGSTIPSTSIRVAFPTQNNADNAFFVPVSTAGQHMVLFSDAAQGDWVKNKSPFEPAKVMLLQLQIPSATTAPVPWDFCIEGLTAIMQ